MSRPENVSVPTKVEREIERLEHALSNASRGFKGGVWKDPYAHLCVGLVIQEVRDAVALPHRSFTRTEPDKHFVEAHAQFIKARKNHYRHAAERLRWKIDAQRLLKDGDELRWWLDWHGIDAKWAREQIQKTLRSIWMIRHNLEAKHAA